ncbi:transmembrane protein 186 [Sceloporus undulatus]|uniref:transmembrane protein 186 n=1 Tax=Sceloporus undulatus TaxID=8520 RepID=UPI001C4BA6A1|nr:transmembrane protein 186 [Sceloporus undulatus]
MFAIPFRLLSIPPHGRCFQTRFPLHRCKGGLALHYPSGVLKMRQPCDPWTLSVCAAHPRWLGTLAHSQEQKSSLEGMKHFRLIYRFPGIRYCRALSRLKLLQTALTLLILPPVWVLYWQNQVPPSLCLYCTGIACFAAAMLYGMSFYLRRIIGLMYLSKDGTLLKVSHLTFWGKRKDIYCPVETVMTLGDVGEDGNDLLLRFQQYNRESFLYFSLRLGKIVDPEGFAKVFGQTE